jgi:hypothetical protein
MLTNTLYSHPKIKNPRGSKGRFTFEIDEPELVDVTFQLTSKDKLGIFAPVGLDIEDITKILKPILDEATGKPVKLEPYYVSKPGTIVTKDLEDKLKQFLENWNKNPCPEGLPPPIDEVMVNIGLDPKNQKHRDSVYEMCSRLHYLYKLSKEVSEERKIRHSDELKKLINDWISEFPSVEGVKIKKFEFGPSALIFKGEDKEIFAESNPLFDDLKCHLPDIIKNWEEFKKLTKDFWELRSGLEEKIKEIVLKNFEGFKIFEKGDFSPNSIWIGLIDEVLEEACGYYSYPIETMLKSEVSIKHYSDRIEIGADRTYYIAVKLGFIEEAKLKDWVKEKLNNILEEVKHKCSNELENLKTKIEGSEEKTKIKGLKDKIKSIKERLIEASNMPILPGYCKYLIEPYY